MSQEYSQLEGSSNVLREVIRYIPETERYTYTHPQGLPKQLRFIAETTKINHLLINRNEVPTLWVRDSNLITFTQTTLDNDFLEFHYKNVATQVLKEMVATILSTTAFSINFIKEPGVVTAGEKVPHYHLSVKIRCGINKRSELFSKLGTNRSLVVYHSDGLPRLHNTVVSEREQYRDTVGVTLGLYIPVEHLLASGFIYDVTATFDKHERLHQIPPFKSNKEFNHVYNH